MEITFTVDALCADSASVKTEQTANVDGKVYVIGEPSRRAYVNSERGRAILQEDVPEPYLSAILAVWGDTPTMNET